MGFFQKTNYIVDSFIRVRRPAIPQRVSNRSPQYMSWAWITQDSKHPNSLGHHDHKSWFLTYSNLNEELHGGGPFKDH